MESIYRVVKLTNVLDRDVRLPGSKSISNRALLLAALSEGKTELTNLLFSDDTRYMAGALRDLGLRVEADESRAVCTVHGTGRPPKGGAKLYVGNAGTAMRFLASYLCLGEGEFLLDGDQRMRQRPIADLVEALSALGCDVCDVDRNGCPPLAIRAKGIRGGECVVTGKNSSQYISSLLLAAPCSERGVTVRTGGEVSSKPYIDMTLRMMEQFGARVERDGYRKFKVNPTGYRSPGRFGVEPDASSASYFLAAAAIAGGRVRIEGLGENSLQGDTAFAGVLGKMGASVTMDENFVELRSDGHLRGIDIDMNAIPDMVLTLAAAALFAEGETRITNVANLRIKESDRITALCTELRKLGAEVEELSDGLVILPAKSYRGASIATYNDHRIAMAFAVAGLFIEGIVIENPGCVSKTFPDFFDYLERFCGH
jgi:3-phosphoshikimate 1-carboxyvinyltransferase